MLRMRYAVSGTDPAMLLPGAVGGRRLGTGLQAGDRHPLRASYAMSSAGVDYGVLLCDARYKQLLG
eukprot:3376567-Rhodomonas_salina.1